MESKCETVELTNGISKEYEAPELTAIGNASDVVLGIAVGGFDGNFGMTEGGFEFELDDQYE